MDGKEAIVLAVVFGVAIVTGLIIMIGRELGRNMRMDARMDMVREMAEFSAPRQDSSRDAGSRIGRTGRIAVRVISLLAPVGDKEREKLNGLLKGAGFGGDDALTGFLATKIVTAAVLGAATVLAAGAMGYAQTATILTGVMTLVMVMVGGITPEYVLRGRANERRARMNSVFPDALDLCVMCLESGLTFERALATVATEMRVINESLAEEFALIEAELRIGANRRVVLEQIRDRTRIDGMKTLAVVLMQSERFGTPLTQSMKNTATAEREERVTRALSQAERLPVLMTLPMMLFVVPGMLALIAGPAFLLALDAISGATGR